VPRLSYPRSGKTRILDAACSASTITSITEQEARVAPASRDSDSSGNWVGCSGNITNTTRHFQVHFLCCLFKLSTFLCQTMATSSSRNTPLAVRLRSEDKAATITPILPSTEDRSRMPEGIIITPQVLAEQRDENEAERKHPRTREEPTRPSL
jgi:hypothetical protein